MTIHPLSEGEFTIGFDKIFVPFDSSKDQLNDRPTGSILVEVQPFLIQVNNKNILFDTGLGYNLPNGQLQIHENLQKIGIKPNDIHSVILSHLHKDHAGGISYQNELGIETFSFPNANYYVFQKEFQYAEENDGKSYHLADFELLKNAPNVIWLTEEKGFIENCISYEMSGGHCPYHCCFLVDDGNEKVFFGADIVPQLVQLKTKYIAKYDFDGKKSMELRQEFAQKGKENNWTFLFYHDVKNPVSKLS